MHIKIYLFGGGRKQGGSKMAVMIRIIEKNSERERRKRGWICGMPWTKELHLLNFLDVKSFQNEY